MSVPLPAAAGPYVGASLGQGYVETGALKTAFDSYVPRFAESHRAWEAFAGYRASAYFSAEVEYVRLGDPGPAVYPTSSAALGTADVDVDQRGYGAFALVYLPLKNIDLFAKAGGARIQTIANVSSYASAVCGGVFCEPLSKQNHFTDIGVAFGGGAQMRIEAFALRAQYERFSAAGGHPYFLSFGAAYSFWP